MIFPPGTILDIPPLSETRGRHRTYHADHASTGAERKKEFRKTATEIKHTNIAVLDFETDPFDDVAQDIIRPFAACLYSDQFDTVMIWEDDFNVFVQRVLDELAEIEEPFTIYAHNGGKFDYMFLMHKLRGKVSFKGRGLMSARVGIHEIRDSFHIIPEKLAAYRKEIFDYSKMKKALRNQHRPEIEEYLLSDCVYLFDIVKAFVAEFGLKLSIGQAAMTRLKQHYKVGSIGANTDESLRKYFFGGRVECLAGRGHWHGNYKLYDVNSMYSDVMANCLHPISANYTLRRTGTITEKTVFLEIECENWGALVRRTEDNETTATADRGTFLTTIWEFETALELGLIDRVKIKGLIDNDERSNFSKHIVPIYEKRMATKAHLAELKAMGMTDSNEFMVTKKDDMFLKFLLNTGYGKFAQNPRRFKETYITNPGDRPDGSEAIRDAWGDILFPHFECADYWIWQKPISHFRFNNVGTAASITGAARSKLLRAIHNAIDPIYCDTDSLICKELNNTEIHKTKLGAWDLEAEFSEVIICGKKLYACKPKDWNGQEAQIKVASKGTQRVKWADFEKMLTGDILPFVNPAPTFNKFGRQFYQTRNIRATAPVLSTSTRHQHRAIS